MDYHEYTLMKYMEKVDEDERLNDAIDAVLSEIEENYPDVLPDDFDECWKIGFDIVTNDYNIASYMEDYINKEN